MPDRIQIKEEAKQVLRGARVNPYLVSLIVVGVLGLLGGLDSYVGASQTVDQMAGYDPDLAAMLPSFPEFPVLLVAFVGAVNWLAQAILSAGWSIVCAGPFLHRVDPAVRPDSGHSGHLAGPLPGAGQRGLFPGDQAGEGHRLPVRPR